MNPKRLDIFLLLFSLLLCFFAFDICAQKKTSKKTAAKIKLLGKPKIISGGVLNGKSVNLAKPEFPASAAFVNVKGSVSIQVLFNEAGNIINAKATKGHPLLIPASLKAALKSKFVPCAITNNPVQVSGVIVYNYISDKMNWLEIGFNFDVNNNIYEALPPDFVDEKLMLIQAKTVGNSEKQLIYNSVENLVKSKIAADEKKTWLFSLGQNLKELSMKHWDAEQKKNLLAQIELQLLDVPQSVSPILIRKLESLRENNFDKFNNTLLDLIDKLYALGN